MMMRGQGGDVHTLSQNAAPPVSLAMTRPTFPIEQEDVSDLLPEGTSTRCCASPSSCCTWGQPSSSDQQPQPGGAGGLRGMMHVPLRQQPNDDGLYELLGSGSSALSSFREGPPPPMHVRPPRAAAVPPLPPQMHQMVHLYGPPPSPLPFPHPVHGQLLTHYASTPPPHPQFHPPMKRKTGAPPLPHPRVRRTQSRGMSEEDTKGADKERRDTAAVISARERPEREGEEMQEEVSHMPAHPPPPSRRLSSIEHMRVSSIILDAIAQEVAIPPPILRPTQEQTHAGKREIEEQQEEQQQPELRTELPLLPPSPAPKQPLTRVSYHPYTHKQMAMSRSSPSVRVSESRSRAELEQRQLLRAASMPCTPRGPPLSRPASPPRVAAEVSKKSAPMSERIQDWGDLMDLLLDGKRGQGVYRQFTASGVGRGGGGPALSSQVSQLARKRTFGLPAHKEECINMILALQARVQAAEMQSAECGEREAALRRSYASLQNELFSLRVQMGGRPETKEEQTQCECVVDTRETQTSEEQTILPLTTTDGCAQTEGVPATTHEQKTQTDSVARIDGHAQTHTTDTCAQDTQTELCATHKRETQTIPTQKKRPPSLVHTHTQTATLPIRLPMSSSASMRHVHRCSQTDDTQQTEGQRRPPERAHRCVQTDEQQLMALASVDRAVREAYERYRPFFDALTTHTQPDDISTATQLVDRLQKEVRKQRLTIQLLNDRIRLRDGHTSFDKVLEARLHMQEERIAELTQELAGALPPPPLAAEQPADKSALQLRNELSIVQSSLLDAQHKICTLEQEKQSLSTQLRNKCTQMARMKNQCAQKMRERSLTQQEGPYSRCKWGCEDMHRIHSVHTMPNVMRSLRAFMSEYRPETGGFARAAMHRRRAPDRQAVSFDR
ncbi:unnamed protein product [Vitrella brassicaformis CCMP3155]|uniref:Uncharacterized protein n=3 Tax=Vitrella brassicaformis TaxID=1169539 RepID=A0A0G4ESM5_VITBC|nr:unnamed protein product [Vitrella brassicaformis CCMP3155]|eukprot:CEM01637.1 unnamed protein product [Vitrella brassicaformis CCMP3155]